MMSLILGSIPSFSGLPPYCCLCIIVSISQVISAEQQVVKKRVKRSIVNPHDAMWDQQWYLVRDSWEQVCGGL